MKKKIHVLQKRARQLAEDFAGHPIGLALLLAAFQSRCIDCQCIIAVEFGVARGKSLKAMCDIITVLQPEFQVKFELYGFDRKGGMPELVKDHRDHNELWHEGEFKDTNFDDIADETPDYCQLILGDVRDTVKKFVDDKLGQNSLLGFVSIDLDLYSSTSAALEIFNSTSSNYLPIVPMYFDDVYGSPCYNPWCGELLTIKEFNEEHECRKIHHYGGDYKKIHMCQILDHPCRTGDQTPSYLNQCGYEVFGL